MFTSQSLRAVVQPGALTVREQRLDTVVHQLEVRGTLDEATIGELAAGRRGAGRRGALADRRPHGAVTVAEQALAALVTAARELRSRKGELIVAGARTRSPSGSRPTTRRTSPRRRRRSTRRS